MLLLRRPRRTRRFAAERGPDGLPRARPAPSPRERDAAARVPSARGLALPPEGILLVDDDEFMLEMLPRRLRKVLPEGTRITAVRTPEEALERVRACRDGDLVVLSDFDLRASMDGRELLTRIAQERPGTVRILFSGHAPHEIGALDETAIHGFVEKPMRLDDLLPPLLRLLESAL